MTLLDTVTYYFRCSCGLVFEAPERDVVCPQCQEIPRLYGLKDSDGPEDPEAAPSGGADA